MAGAAGYTAVLDANVLYPALLRDILLSLAHANLYVARWTSQIEDEWTRHLIEDKPEHQAQILKVAAAMRDAIPDCLIKGHETVIPTLTLPDPDDRHVLAAAIVGHADAIVTSNTKDFPQDILGQYDIELQTPDEFVANQIMLHKVRSLSALKKMRERWRRPEMTAQEMIARMEFRGLVSSAAHLWDAVDLL